MVCSGVSMGCAKIDQAGVQKIRGNDMDNFKMGLGMSGEFGNGY